MDLLEEILHDSKHAAKKLWKIAVKLMNPTKEVVEKRKSFARVLLQVDLEHPKWHKSLNSVLKRSMTGVREYIVESNGSVSVSGFLDEIKLHKKLERVEGKVMLTSVRSGQCSSYLHA